MCIRDRYVCVCVCVSSEEGFYEIICPTVVTTSTVLVMWVDSSVHHRPLPAACAESTKSVSGHVYLADKDFIP